RQPREPRQRGATPALAPHPALSRRWTVGPADLACRWRARGAAIPRGAGVCRPGHCPQPGAGRGTGRSALTAEASPALLVVTDGAQQIDAAKGRPVNVREIELRVGALPQQKAGQADLATGADDQIRIRHAGHVQMAADGIRIDLLDDLVEARSPLAMRTEQRAHRIDYLRASAIGYGDRQHHVVV